MDKMVRATRVLTRRSNSQAPPAPIDEAVSSYRKAIQINDSKMSGQSSTELAIELADVLWRNKRLTEARETLQEALVFVGPGQPLRAAEERADTPARR
jgi:hypothetical protein